MTPASIRNKNPSAQYPGKSAKKFGSTTHEVLKSADGTHLIATFPTSIHGAAAQFDLLNTSYTGMTLDKAVRKWCGDIHGATYIKVVRDRTGLDPDCVITKAMIADHEQAIPLAKAMAWQEAGQEYPLKDDEWIEAHVMAMGAKAAAPSWNPRNDVPTPKYETRMRKYYLSVKAALGGISIGGLMSIFDAPYVPPVPAGLKQNFANLSAWGDVLPPVPQWKMMVLGGLAFVAVAFGGQILQWVRR